MNQATNECLGKKAKVTLSKEGMDEPSHKRVSWLKI